MGLAEQYVYFKKLQKKDRTTEKLGGGGRTIHEARRKDVSGTLVTVRKLSAEEMGGKGYKESLKKVVMERLHARDLKRKKCRGRNHWCVQPAWH